MSRPTKTLRVVLDLVVADLPEAEREAIRRDCGLDALAGLADFEPGEIACQLAGLGTKPVNALIFGGSDVTVQFAGVRIILAEWVDGTVVQSA